MVRHRAVQTGTSDRDVQVPGWKDGAPALMTPVDSREHADAVYWRLPTQLTALFDADITSSPILVFGFLRRFRFVLRAR